MIKRGIYKMFLLTLVLFVAPAILSLAHWRSTQDLPSSWRTADWSSAKIFKHATLDPQAVIYVMAARTGGTKGAFSVHSWIVTKRANEEYYRRYDKLGWGYPVRLNAFPPDGNWYSNPPRIVAEFRGGRATQLIPKIESAIKNYPYANRGDYRIWPGPNSNTFIAHILNEVPEMGIVLPPNAVGRDYKRIENWIEADNDFTNIQLSLAGYAGMNVGTRNGIEFNFLGLVTGFDFSKLALKLPGFGEINVGAEDAEASSR